MIIIIYIALAILFFVFPYIFIFFVLDKIIVKTLGIKKKVLSVTKAKNIEKWGRITWAILLICMVLIDEGNDFRKWFMILYLPVLLGFQAFLEWRYLRETRQYISTVVTLLACVIYGCFF